MQLRQYRCVVRALHLIAVAAILLGAAPVSADLVFTSEPPTSAAVGRAYSYRMTAADIADADRDGDDDDDDDDRDDDDRRLTYIARALPAWLTFDGDDTIFGTPRPEDVGQHRVSLRVKAKRDEADQNFTINVAPVSSGAPAEGADLAASISVSPESASVGDSVRWRVTARNLADADVANVVLHTAFSGDAAFELDPVDACSIEPRGDETVVVCRWAPLTSGSAQSVRVSGRATGAGEILAVASVSIADAVPKDRNPANDEAKVRLRVTDGSPSSPPGVDADAPVLSLNGASTLTVTVGETFEDPGATAVDDVDGDLTSKVVVDNPVDTKVIGRYSVTYEVVDSAGNTSTATRTVEIVPLAPGGGGGGGAVGIALLLPLVLCAFLGRRAVRAAARPRARG